MLSFEPSQGKHLQGVRQDEQAGHKGQITIRSSKILWERWPLN